MVGPAAERDWATHQIVEYAFVQAPLSWPALPQLLVVVVQALVMGAELLKAGFIDVFDTGLHVSERLLDEACNYPSARLRAHACAGHNHERARHSGPRSGAGRYGLGRCVVRTRSLRI